MPAKTVWTLLSLYRWTPPKGVSVLYSVCPWTDTVYVTLCTGLRSCRLEVTPRWRARDYRPGLDRTAAELLHLERTDASADKLAHALDRAFDSFDAVKAAVLRKEDAC